MIGRNHALSGLIAGTVTAGLLHTAPPLVRLVAIPVFGGAALLSDADTQNSRVSHSIGFITRRMAFGVAWLAVLVYHATRTDADSPRDNGGHRRLTHTIPAAVFAGLIVAGAVLINPIAGAVVLALLIGLLAQGFRALGGGFVLAGGAGAWMVITRYPQWWWVWPAVVTGGVVVHILGDTVTNSGTPLLWPLRYRGQRWAKIRTPLTFSTGQGFELVIVTTTLWLALAGSAAFALATVISKGVV